MSDNRPEDGNTIRRYAHIRLAGRCEGIIESNDGAFYHVEDHQGVFDRNAYLEAENAKLRAEKENLLRGLEMAINFLADPVGNPLVQQAADDLRAGIDAAREKT